jgi:L-seryl-tRNA(Ser) seleniumtransferase
MDLTERQRHLLRRLPAVDRVIDLAKTESGFERVPPSVVVGAIRTVIEAQRCRIREGNGTLTDAELTDAAIMDRVKETVALSMRPNLRRVVNATGIVVHTNLGRSLLAREAIENIVTVAAGYSNLEYDLAQGKRGSRYAAVQDLLCEITGAEAAMVVNNNAGAVLVSLESLARDRQVIVSRGELVEIGGSFRIPDVMAKSNAVLKEVGTTNRTHLRDYESAIAPETGLLLKVHCSNYTIVGFTQQVSLQELVGLGAAHHLPVMEDLGSGTFIDFSRYGLLKEPTVQASVASGADVITFSGDKLLGGPQAGIIVGKKTFIERIRQNPITRALRIDKLTLAALESTLRLYRDEERAVAEIPTLRMLTETETAIAARAAVLAQALANLSDARLAVELVRLPSKAGGGALPLLELPSRCLRIRVDGLSAHALELRLRGGNPHVIGRIEDDAFVMDVRTIQNDEFLLIESALAAILKTD